MNEAKEQVLRLKDILVEVYAGYLHRDDESLGEQARVLAPHLPEALSSIYSSLGGQ